MGSLRLLLALSVVFAHAGPAFGWQSLRMTGGPLAVQMFYIVSGFYMALVLNEKYVGQGAWSAFARSRLLRLFPMYLVVAAATLLVGLGMYLGGWTIDPLARWFEYAGQMPWLDALALGLVQVTLVGQDAVVFTAVEPETSAVFFTTDFHRYPLPAWEFMLVPQAWTISLEIMFYAVAPLIVRRHVGVIAALLVASLLLRYLLMHGLHLVNDPWTYRFFPTELALFLAGALAYRAYRRMRGGPWLRPALGWTALLGTIGVVLTYRLLPDVLRSAPYGLSPVLIALPFVLPFVFQVSARWRLDRALGELSYPVYLVHYLFCFVLTAVGVRLWSSTSGLVVAALTLVASWLLWRFVGQPIEIGRQRIGSGLRRNRAAVAPEA